MFSSAAGSIAKGAGEWSVLRSDVGTMLFGAVSGGVGSVLGGGNFWMGAATGLIVTGFNHVVHKMGGPLEKDSEDNGCEKPGCNDYKKANQLANEYDNNKIKITSNSIVMLALAETTKSGKIASRVRTIVIQTFGSTQTKEANKVYDGAMAVVNALKQKYGKDIPDIVIYEMVFLLGAKTLSLQVTNGILANRIESLCESLYIDRITHEKYGGSFGGGGAKGSY